MRKARFGAHLLLISLSHCLVQLTAVSFHEQMTPSDSSVPQYKVIEEDFKRACIFVREQKKMDQEDKLQLYGLFKCATVGICNTTSPSIFEV